MLSPTTSGPTTGTRWTSSSRGTGGRVAAIEVKATGTPRTADCAGLAKLRDALGDRFFRGVLLHLGTGSHALPFGERIEALPVSALWQCPAP